MLFADSRSSVGLNWRARTGTHLTERVVKAAEIGERKYVIFDEDCAGFGLCVFESGRKGFILIYRAAGRQRRMTIGTSYR